MPTVNSNGIDLYYEVHGAGEPLVLIAGLGYDAWMWHRMIPGLAERFQVISFDNRGVGHSDKPAGPYTARLLAKGVDTVCKKVGEEATEVVIAAKGREREQVIRESADLLYHLVVLWQVAGVGMEDVARELAARRRGRG